ncbi:MAG: hypothetical protein CL910_07470 [Deltaproteobacteria bacterium]|nr:hypothetical protein [Deltaproteobacteria bacterium]
MGSRFRILVTDDEMAAQVGVVGGAACGADDLRRALEDAGVCQGILEEALETLAQQVGDPVYACEAVSIAEGKAARDGKSGALHIDATRDIPGAHLAGEAGTSKPDRGASGAFFANVISGQEIGHLDPCDPGEPGYTVTGKRLDCAPVEDPSRRLGDGVEKSPEDIVHATKVGVLRCEDGEGGVQVVPLPADKRVLLAISSDQMRATAQLFAGKAGEEGIVAAVLAAAGVCHGVAEAASRELGQKLRDPAARIEEILLASATPATEGDDGYFEPDFPVGALAGTLREDGSTDFRDRSALVAVELEQVLGTHHGPTEGTSGTTVLGGELAPKPGKDRPPKLGTGAELRDEGRVVATSAGVVSYEPGGTLRVSDASEHKGDVDLRSGDLKVNGAIVVTGDITRNAALMATGAVVIKGMVDGGSVESDASVTVTGGVVCQGKASIRSGGDVVCHHTQGARVECLGTLTLQHDAVNSPLRAQRIVGETETVRILGGEARAEEQIVVGEVGSHLGARTVLAVGRYLPWKHETVAAQLGGGEGTESSPSNRHPERSGAHPKPGAAAGPETGGRDPRGLLEAARIEVTGTLHPGVVIQIGEHSRIIEQEMRGVQFRRSKEADGEIEVTLLTSTEAPA